jgi:hypothetical protein
MRWVRPFGIIALGLALGAALGLYLGWVAWPTEFSDATPALLADSYKQDYLLMAATAYAADGDLAAARQAVQALGENGQAYLNAYVLDQILGGNRAPEMGQLAQLAHDLGLDSPALQPYLNNPGGTAP